ncbi:MAG TPA: hypothetical protein VK705_09410 [Ferruginibacter sp.]|nr:hypothetical protein [Ferruginibacter sp.]
MKLQLVSTLLFTLAITAVNGKAYFTPFNKNDYYSAIASQNIETINNEIEIVKASAIAEKSAYEGTLLMIKAGLVKKIPDKISLFKSGRLKLENCIKNNNKNAELRFLRLMVQENAPPIVNYKSDLEKDKIFIEKKFKTLATDLQKYILDYSKRSKILNTKDF